MEAEGGGDGAEEAFFNGDTDGTPDWYFATRKERLKSILGVEEATAVVNRAAGGETAHRSQHKWKQKSTAVGGFAVVSRGF